MNEITKEDIEFLEYVRNLYSNSRGYRQQHCDLNLKLAKAVRQIQRIQDSKNPHQLRENEVDIEDGYKTMNITDNVNVSLALKEKIEQNQKIVDLLILHYQHAEHSNQTEASILSEIYNDATGKDIKELS